MKVKLSSLLCSVYTSEGERILPLELSPCFDYLETRNAEPYERYHNWVKAERNPNDNHSTASIEALCSTILQKGYVDTPLMRVRLFCGHFVLTDGQHRACILKYYNLCDEVEVGID